MLPPLNVLLFSRTLGFRHGSIPVATVALQNIGADAGWVVEATEDQTQLTAQRLGDAGVVVFLLTSGDVLDAAQETAFEEYIRGGGGYVGVHSATDTEYGWSFYTGPLVGASFAGHPAIQQATVKVDAASHPAVAGLPSSWVRTDEWYNFTANVRTSSTVVLTIDESTYSGGTMGSDHPIAWAREVDAGRAFYTALGHTDESYAEALFLGHLKAAIEWAAKRR